MTELCHFCLGEAQTVENLALFLLQLHDLVLEGHQAIHAGSEILGKSLESGCLGEGLPSLLFLFVGELDGFGSYVVGQDFEDSLDVFDGEVVEIDFTSQFVNFLLDVELWLFLLSLVGSFNYALLLLLVGFVGPM